MNAPTLFDMVRAGDPAPSHEAAVAVAPGCKECIDAIGSTVAAAERMGHGAVTAFQIAASIELSWPGRWDEGTIRRRVKDARLRKVDEDGVSPRGRACTRWTL